MKNKIIFILCSIFVFSFGVLFLSSNINDDVLTNEIKRDNKPRTTLSMNFETGSGTAVYQEATDKNWPTSGYTFNTELSKCENGSEISWDDTNKKVIISGVKNDKCYVYFNKEPIPASETLISKNEMINENGYRYEGQNPNNYVEFNDELWRIIGVFDVENSDTKKIESLVKLIRNESIGYLRFDTGGEWGSSVWTISDIKAILNGQYYNGENINYTYRNASNSQIASDPTVSITGKSINDTARAMIQSINWKLGGLIDDGFTAKFTAEQFYTAERGTAVYDDRLADWDGMISLMYASDYGYAVDESSCPRTITLYDYSETSACYEKNWLYTVESQMLLTPCASAADGIYDVNVNKVWVNSPVNPRQVRPTLYLKSSIEIVGGSGTETDPYRIS